MANLSQSWVMWALLSAVFAALTAIFAKVGIEGIGSNFATFLRTLVVIAALAAILYVRHEFQPLAEISKRSAVFLVLSGLATGASWLCYFRALQLGNASQVAPVDKLSVVLVALFAFAFLGELPSFKAWAGIALIAVGSLLVALG